MLSRRGSVSLSSSGATLLLFLFVSLPLPLPLLATPAPDQYGAATAHHYGHQPELRSMKLQSSETLLPLQDPNDGQLHSIKLQKSGYIPSETLLPLQQPHDGQLHSIKLQHPSETLHSLQTPQENDKLSSDPNKKDAQNVGSVDTSQIHRVKLTKTDYQTGSLLSLQVSQPIPKENDHKKNDVPLSDSQTGSIDAKSQSNIQKETIQYEGDDAITIDDVKKLDESLQDTEEGDYNGQLEELDINVEDNNVPLINSNIRRAKREAQEETVRQKRDFIRWYGTSSFHAQPPQQTYISSYQLSARVPYFIPIWGNPGRIPVFFPLKPILFNPGYPIANPPIPVPTQQPTINEGTEYPSTGNVSVGNRINVDQEDNPVWGVVESDPIPGQSNNNGGAAQRPQSSKPRTPPLIHRPSRTDADDDTIEPNLPPIAQVPNDLNPTRPLRPVTRPPQIPENNRDPFFDVSNTPRPTFVPAPTTRRPQSAGFPGSFPPANNQVNNNSGRREPSRCVWAVISCCSPLSTNVRYSCFEQLGCNGSFWDGNPCSREYTAAALNAAQRFYEQSGTRR